MPDAIAKATIREIEPLRQYDSGRRGRRAASSTRTCRACPVVDEEGGFVGIFGEREFMQALFPGYVGELASARMVSRDIDSVIERRVGCRDEPVSEHMTTDHVVVEDDYSDTELAEIFLHHRVLIVPVATEGKVHALITRNDFFRELARKLG